MERVKGRAIHRCLHVLDIDKSLEFYDKALGLKEIRRMGPDDGSWMNVFIGDDASGFQLELTWNKGRVEPYENGGRDSHVAFTVSDIDAARAVHEEMGCICHVNERMGLYFIEDPDGCWLEILPEKPDNLAQSGVDVLAAMGRRHSVRKYAEGSIAPEKVERILDAALLSASGMAKRPWELVVIEDRETLDALVGCREHGSAMLSDAAAAIVVLADVEKSDTWIEDCSIVMANMHLAASSLDVGSCWIQGRMRMASDGRTTNDYVRELLGYPESFELEAILSLGIPEKTSEMREPDEKLLDKVHHGRF